MFSESGTFADTLHLILAKLLEDEAAKVIFKNSFRTAKETQLFTIIKINWLKLLKEIIPV
jgi:hypothetical protein